MNDNSNDILQKRLKEAASSNANPVAQVMARMTAEQVADLTNGHDEGDEIAQEFGLTPELVEQVLNSVFVIADTENGYDGKYGKQTLQVDIASDNAEEQIFDFLSKNGFSHYYTVGYGGCDVNIATKYPLDSVEDPENDKVGLIALYLSDILGDIRPKATEIAKARHLI